MYYTGLDPATMQPVYVSHNPHEKAMQRALIQYRNPSNYDLVYEALKKEHREDLIGFDQHCLIRPRKLSEEKEKSSTKGMAGKDTVAKHIKPKQKRNKTTAKRKQKTR